MHHRRQRPDTGWRQRPSGGVTDQDLQNAKGRARDQVGNLINKVIGVERDKAVGGHEVEGAHNAQQQARSHDGGDDGNKDVAEHLNGTHKDVLLLSRGLLYLGLGGSLDAAERDELFVDLVDGASAKNNLELALGLKDALGAVDILEGLLVDLGVIGNHQAQTGGAVCGRNNVVGATDVVEHLLGCFAVVHDFPFLQRAHVHPAIFDTYTVIVFSLI